MTKKEIFIKRINDRKTKMKEIFDNIPAINWEILRYANTHNKEETLLQYPEYKEIINTIVFNNKH